MSTGPAPATWIDTLEVPEGAVILLKGFHADDDSEWESIAEAIHEKHPKSLVVWLDEGSTFETLPYEAVRDMLRELIHHQIGSIAGDPAKFDPVTVTFPTNVDQQAHQMTDAMWIDLGKFVADLAEHTRSRRMSEDAATVPGE